MNIFIDGTWNTPKNNTNIHKLYKKYDGYYFPGPGTKAFFLDRILGGAFGKGTEDLAEQVHRFIIKNYRKGPLNIFGYSRGATASRRVCYMITKKGGKVDFLGCFDTVSALGVPFGFWPFTTYDDLFMDTEVHPNVIRAAHVMAKDEHRASFKNTPMDERDGIVQRGFSGDHSVMGNSSITLKWMIDQFEEGL